MGIRGTQTSFPPGSPTWGWAGQGSRGLCQHPVTAWVALLTSCPVRALADGCLPPAFPSTPQRQPRHPPGGAVPLVSVCPQKPLAPLGPWVTEEYQEPTARSAAGRHRPPASPGATQRRLREMALTSLLSRTGIGVTTPLWELGPEV